MDKPYRIEELLAAVHTLLSGAQACAVVRIADTPHAFVGAVAAALDEEGTARAARMAQEAALLGQYAWDQIAREMDALITDRVERKHAG